MSGSLSHSSGSGPDARPSWDGASYAANTAHHRRYDGDFLATLPLEAAAQVLDLGCGAGDLTATVAGLVPDGHVVGVDAQPSMISEARARAGDNQTFLVAAAQDVAAAVGDHAPFDVVFSRAVLHWVPADEHPSVLAQCRSLLRPGGALRIECGGGDNVPEVVDVVGRIAQQYGHSGACPWTFFPAGAYLDLVLAAGFSVEGGFVRTVAQRRPFDRERVLGWLHSQCLNAYEATIDPARHADLRAEVTARVDELRRADGSYDRSFVRLDVLAFAPG